MLEYPASSHLCCVLFRLSSVSSCSIIWHTCLLSGLVKANGEQSRKSMLGLALSTYIRPIAISVGREVNQPTVVDPGNCLQ